MGKFYDALEKAKVEPPAAGLTPSVDLPDPPAPVEIKTEAPVQSPPDHVNGSRLDRNLITLLNPHCFESEQFKILRTKLFFPAEGKTPKTIMVTSAMLGEGKSFVAANLAVTIAQSINEHVLLVDGDLRRPTIHSRFGFSDEVPGLSDYLSKGASLHSLLVKTDLPKLTILPGGRPVDNPAELLASTKMSNLIQEIRSRYSDRYIVIDSPPPKLTAESGAIARQVDGILLVIKYAGTRREMIASLVENLGAEKILGVIFNRFDIRSTPYGYGTYGKYGNYYRKASIR